jgi:hypothetical protein
MVARKRTSHVWGEKRVDGSTDRRRFAARDHTRSGRRKGRRRWKENKWHGYCDLPASSSDPSRAPDVHNYHRHVW